MDLNEWLNGSGRTVGLAQHCKVTPSAVSQWKTNGVPVRHMEAVSAFTAGEVSVEDLLAQMLALKTKEAA